MKHSPFNIPGLINSSGRSINLGSKKIRSTEVIDSLLTSGIPQVGKINQAFDARPLKLLMVGLLVTSLVLLFQLTRLQLVNGARYAGLAEGNRLRQKVAYAPRGRILDRRGRELATNTATFQLIVYPYLLPKNEAERKHIYTDVAQLLKLSTNDVQTKAEAEGLDFIQPQLLAENIAYQPALVIEQQLPSLPGLILDEVPVRNYISDAGLSHVLGYVGRANEQDLADRSELLPVDFVGKDGIEAEYDRLLRGQNGVAETEVDAAGRPLRVLREISTQPGKDIILTIDYDLQKQLIAGLNQEMQRANVKRASAVVLDPRNGEVLAMASLPAYDNNLFSRGISETDYQRLIDDPLQALHNKAIGGGYPSGSIIKPLHLAGALEAGVVNEQTTIVDRGKISVPSIYDASVIYTFLGWNLAGLGPMNARRAIAMSSDIYFYTVGGGYEGFKGLGVDRLTDYYRKFGLGELTGIDLPGESAGRVPTPEWKKQTQGEDWFVGDTYNISIGQGDLLVSPLQMATGTATIANGGQLLKPHLFMQTSAGDIQQPTETIRAGFIKPQYLQVVREGMKQVIGGTTSTATFSKVPVPVAGKSGTAETDPGAKKRAHAWYTAFAPYDNPQIVFAVLLEEGEGGSQFAAPVIARAMEWYFSGTRP